MLFALAASIVAAGCAMNPPYLSGPRLAGDAREALPGARGAIEVFDNAGWFPYVDGFRQLREDARPYRGALALDDAALAFLVWDEDLKKVEAAKRIPLAEMKSVELDGLRQRRLVVIRLRDGTVHAFEFVREGGHRVDPGAAERALASIRLRMAPKAGPT